MIHGPDSHGNQDADYRGSRNESTKCKYVEYHFRPPSNFRLIIHSGDSGFSLPINGGFPIVLMHRLLVECFSNVSRE